MQAERTPFTEFTSEQWWAEAERLLTEALAAFENYSEEPIILAGEALCAMHLACGETPHTVVLDVGGYPRHREELAYEPPCTCPPEMVERGGWSSKCAYHGPGSRKFGAT